MNNKCLHVADNVRLLSAPDRKMDSVVTALLRGPRGVVLDDRESLDGWDIVYNDDPENVWMGADEVLYVTRHMEAAFELCAQVSDCGPAVIIRALAAVVKYPPAVDTVEALNGQIARFIISEMLEELGKMKPKKLLAA